MKIFRYPGGKAKLLPQIMPFIEESLKNREGFCDSFVGGGSVLLHIAEKYPNLQLFCNDKDYFVYSFWKLMSEGSKPDIANLKELIKQKPTIDLYYQLRASDPTNQLEAAYRALFFNRTSFSGDMRRGASAIGGKSQQSKYKIDCRYNTEKLNQQIEDISKLLYGRTIVSNLDINNFDILHDDKICNYLDPPYVVMGHMLYEESMKPEEHIKLATNLKLNKNWILSYDNCPEVINLYEWAKVHFIDAAYCIRGNKTSWHKTKEVLIVPE